jgi:AcrR family transcriptional regulator
MPAAATSPERSPRWTRRFEEAVDAAAAIFCERGYQGASTRDIADRLGIRQATLYYYFSSKEAALAEVCRRGVEDYVERLRVIAAGEGSVREKLRLAVESHLSPLRAEPQSDYTRVFVRHRHELPETARRAIGATARRYETLLEKLLVEGVARGELRRDLDPRLGALAFLGLCNSVTVWYGHRRGPSLEKIIDEYGILFLDGVSA